MSLTILLAGCAGLMGPMGPPLGLGPGWDELAGIVIIGWVAAIAYRPYGSLQSAACARLTRFHRRIS